MAEASHASWRVASQLAHAKALIERQDFEAAASVYQDILVADLADDLRLEARTNLAAALCAMAQDERVTATRAVAYLDQARSLQIEVLKAWRPEQYPRDWVSGRANLALIHLARYRITRDEQDVLLAHLALDGIGQILERIEDPDMQNWVGSIRNYLLELRDRRTNRR